MSRLLAGIPDLKSIVSQKVECRAALSMDSGSARKEESLNPAMRLPRYSFQVRTSRPHLKTTADDDDHSYGPGVQPEDATHTESHSQNPIMKPEDIALL